MKVLIVNDHKFGGGTESVVSVQHQLFKDTITIDVLYGEEVCPTVNVFSYIYSFAKKKLVYEKVIEGNYDIVHLHNYYHIYSPSILKALQKAKLKNRSLKVVYTAHDFHLVCPNSGYYYFKKGKITNFKIEDSWKRMMYKLVDKRSIIHDLLKKLQWINAYVLHDYKKVIDVITTPSYFLKDVLLAHYNLNVQVIRNPMSLNNTKLNLDTNKDDILKIVFFGRLSIEKGLKEFISSLHQIQEIDFHFSIIGEGPQSDELKEYVNHLQLSTKVSFLGKMAREKLLPSLVNYDLFVLPSVWYENAPMSILEAAQANLLIATHDVGGMYEMVEAVGGGFYFKQENADSLRACLNKVIIAKNNHTHIVDEKVFADFLPEKFTSNFMELYHNLLNN